MASVLDAGYSGPGWSTGRGHCAVFLCKTLYKRVPPNLKFGVRPRDG